MLVPVDVADFGICSAGQGDRAATACHDQGRLLQSNPCQSACKGDHDEVRVAKASGQHPHLASKRESRLTGKQEDPQDSKETQHGSEFCHGVRSPSDLVAAPAGRRPRGWVAEGRIGAELLLPGGTSRYC